ncbi:probable G-protein coupled receptor No18 [Neodiprion pinetum]|uniref:tyramine receptor 1-like n=1 Tax=Neodiprion fabricii TaxID=2872261 RepID=UPI001ED92310|nr:tyramine receptor 1-like [Neodiprion fabricii]XP_046491077.1 tyramine receptor 1-like [Neodiprion pinetum]XP_046628105.1 tyramine receptor 1-like [Neodiprion virginianus]
MASPAATAATSGSIWTTATYSTNNNFVPTSGKNLTNEYTPLWTDLLQAAVFSVLIFVTIVGNTLVIAAVITTRRLRSVTNCFVSSLAAADLLVGLAVMPPAVLLQLNGGHWELGEILCHSWVSLDVLLCTASILSLCAISIDRYLAVTQPLVYSRRRRSKRLAGSMIIVVWLIAGAIASLPMLGCFPNSQSIDKKICSYNMDTSYVIFSAMGSFFLPMLVMLYVYARISCVIARRHRHLETTSSEPLNRRTTNQKERSRSVKSKRSGCSTPLESGGIPFDQIADEGEAENSGKRMTFRTHQQSCINRVARETKTAGTLAVVVGGFVACWLPFFILYLATPFMPTNPPNTLMPALTWLGWINSAINPFIYAFYSADFRLAFWRLTCQKLCRGRAGPIVQRRVKPPTADARTEASRT